MSSPLGWIYVFFVTLSSYGQSREPSSLRKVDRRRFCGETEGVLLCLAREPRQTEPAAKAAEEHKVNSPSVSAKNIAEPAPSERAPLRAKSKAKSLFSFQLSTLGCLLSLFYRSGLRAEPSRVDFVFTVPRAAAPPIEKTACSWHCRFSLFCNKCVILPIF